MSTKKQTKSALEVAEYYLKLAEEKGQPITNKKLQKLVYYAQAWSLVLNKEKLFSEKIEAWVHGPAIPSLYKAFKIFEANPIKLKEYSTQAVFTKKQREVLDAVWKVYGKFEASYLEMLTHSEEPWLQARRGLESDENSSNVITPKSMETFYSKRLSREKV